MSWVIDCSVAMAWCFEDEATERTDALLDRTLTDAPTVPLHWALEVANTLRSGVRRERLTEAQASAKIKALTALPIRHDSQTDQLAFTEIYQLARKHKLTSYDAAYLELAIRLDVPLATNDEDLIVAAKKCGIGVI